jgi:hypothetical protein
MIYQNKVARHLQIKINNGGSAGRDERGLDTTLRVGKTTFSIDAVKNLAITWKDETKLGPMLPTYRRTVSPTIASAILLSGPYPFLEHPPPRSTRP